jgi:hypothetical protein
MKCVMLGLILLLSSATPAAAQVPIRNPVTDGDLYSMSFTFQDAKAAHDTANKFESYIGQALKILYQGNRPSQVVDPKVVLRVFEKGYKLQFEITWSCRLVLVADPAKADYFFTRRGTLLEGATPSRAMEKVERELQASNKVAAVSKKFFIIGDRASDSLSGSEYDGWWYIKEYFMVAPFPQK